MSSTLKKIPALPTISVIGCGNMGAAIVAGLVKSGSLRAENITACDSEQAKIAVMQDALAVRTTLDPVEAVNRADIVIIAVKPHAVSNLLAATKHALVSLNSNRLLVSVAAGIRTSTILDHVGKPLRVARVMPNLPCVVGKGMTGVYASQREDALLVREMFSTVGRAIVVENEDLLDVVTALSASGPAYVFSVIAALVKSGVALGLSQVDALTSALQTVLGAAELMNQRNLSPEELIKQVATPGGTTEAGLAELKAGKLEEVIGNAVAAAAKRARELAN